MKTTMEIQARAFPVTILDGRTGTTKEDQIVLTKQQLQAAQLVGQSATELIYRLYNREGYKVLDIGTPERKEIKMDLEQLWGAYRLHEARSRGATV